MTLGCSSAFGCPHSVLRAPKLPSVSYAVRHAHRTLHGRSNFGCARPKAIYHRLRCPYTLAIDSAWTTSYHIHCTLLTVILKGTPSIYRRVRLPDPCQGLRLPGRPATGQPAISNGQCGSPATGSLAAGHTGSPATGRLAARQSGNRVTGTQLGE